MAAAGVLITFEGGEGAGKTTLIKNFSKQLQKMGYPFLCTRAPGSLKVGEKIRDLLLHSEKGEITPKTELFLFLADRATHVDKEIRPALEAGKIVLCDRFNDSTIAYQGIARGLGEEQVEKLCDFACGGLKPNLTFYLDIDPDIGLERAKTTAPKDRIESEKLVFHKKIREAYLNLAKKNPKRIQIIDVSNLSPEQVYERAWEFLQSHFFQSARP